MPPSKLYSTISFILCLNLLSSSAVCLAAPLQAGIKEDVVPLNTYVALMSVDQEPVVLPASASMAALPPDLPTRIPGAAADPLRLERPILAQSALPSPVGPADTTLCPTLKHYTDTYTYNTYENTIHQNPFDWSKVRDTLRRYRYDWKKHWRSLKSIDWNWKLKWNWNWNLHWSWHWYWVWDWAWGWNWHWYWGQWNWHWHWHGIKLHGLKLHGFKWGWKRGHVLAEEQNSAKSNSGPDTTTVETEIKKNTVRVDRCVPAEAIAAKGLAARVFPGSDDTLVMLNSTDVSGTLSAPVPGKAAQAAALPSAMLPAQPAVSPIFGRICSEVYDNFSNEPDTIGRAYVRVTLSNNGNISCQILSNDAGMSQEQQQEFDASIRDAVARLKSDSDLAAQSNGSSRQSQIALVFDMEKQEGGNSGWHCLESAATDRMGPFFFSGLKLNLGTSNP